MIAATTAALPRGGPADLRARAVRFLAEVVISLKPVVNDPQGLTVRAGLHQLGFDEVTEVRVGKHIALEVDGDSEAEVHRRVAEMCERLLRNPVIEDYRIELRPSAGPVPAVPGPPRMRFGIAVFPGTWSDRDCARAVEVAGHESVYLWHRDRDLGGADCVILPGGFSYGDHLRTGAVARFAPLMESVQEFAAGGGLVLGICNGFQILCEAHLLPGALTRNASLEFRCETVWLRVETAETPFTSACEPDQVLAIPVSHGEGRYVAEPSTLDRLEADAPGRLPLRLARMGRRSGTPPRTGRCGTSPAS